MIADDARLMPPRCKKHTAYDDTSLTPHHCKKHTASFARSVGKFPSVQNINIASNNGLMDLFVNMSTTNLVCLDCVKASMYGQGHCIVLFHNNELLMLNTLCPL